MTGVVAPLTGTVTGVVAPLTGTVTSVVAPLTGTVTGVVAPLTGTVDGVVAPLTGTVTSVVAPLTGTVTNLVAPLTGTVTNAGRRRSRGTVTGVVGPADRHGHERGGAAHGHGIHCRRCPGSGLRCWCARGGRIASGGGRDGKSSWRLGAG